MTYTEFRITLRLLNDVSTRHHYPYFEYSCQKYSIVRLRKPIGYDVLRQALFVLKYVFLHDRENV